jgi:hypothetical protein
VWVIGHSDQIARTMLNRAIQPWSASVRPAVLDPATTTPARQTELLAAQLDALAAQPPR